MWYSILLIEAALIIPISAKLQAAGVSDKPMIIAHRGASGYLPEHTLASKALAHAMKADFLEQDLVMTKDNHLIVFHDLTLQDKTDVVDKFPDKKRADNNYYVIDFTLDEIRQLELLSTESPGARLPFSTFAAAPSELSMKIPTFEEEIEFIQRLNLTREAPVGLYIEIKAPQMHQEQGKDITSKLYNQLMDAQQQLADTPIIIQSFDAKALTKLRGKLDNANWYIPIVQLIGENGWQQAYQNVDGKSQAFNYQRMAEDSGLKEIASYAQGIGINVKHVFADDCSYQGGKRWIQQAQNSGLMVHAFTFRRDKLPNCTTSFKQLHQLFFKELSIDGIFTDYPDVSAYYRDNE
ncbi:glycerophosphodiester phosphodiesterase [Thalassotalea sp. PS06]|uniref:glycerophosphodiester phosphodiesterase n=1 Tax=Thalassotalea sp. PS06 TaxID=2594005 RepID=UPI00163D9D84|nr:glycerophosphodiester phosphodiesterase [Thalassotalea sp. PS06]